LVSRRFHGGFCYIYAVQFLNEQAAIPGILTGDFLCVDNFNFGEMYKTYTFGV
jgi:hypothetical protein